MWKPRTKSLYTDLCGHKLKLKINEYIFSRFFENEPSEICRHLSEKKQKTGFLRPISCKITLKKKQSEEEKRRRREKKQRLVFAGRGLCGSNVFNNPARYIHLSKFVKTWKLRSQKFQGACRRG